MPPRPRRLLAAALLTIALLVPPADAARAAPGEIAGEVPSGGGVALVVWGGGSVEELVADATARGCRLRSAWSVHAGSTWVSHVPGAPAFVNAGFHALHPAGIPADQVLLLTCEQPGAVSVSASSLFQGGALRVRVSRAVRGSATLLGRSFPLAREGEDLAGYVAAGADAPVGPTTLTVTSTDAQGVETQAVRSVTIRPTQWTVDYIVLPPPDPDAPSPPPDEQPRLDALYAAAPTARLWQSQWGPPLGGEPAVSGRFGEQRSFNGGPVQGHHDGTDFAAGAGTPVLAANDGTVVLAELTQRRGNLVVIDHGTGVLSAYGHLSATKVSAGERVTRGQVIGSVGSTGLSTGPHLHWELAVAGVLVDGLRWLDGSQGF